MKRGHGGLNRARSLKINSTQIKISPASSVDYMPYNSIQKPMTEGMNHFTSMTGNKMIQQLNGMPDQEALAPRSLYVANADTGKHYQVIE